MDDGVVGRGAACTCDDTCMFANDMSCDDGGPGATSIACARGTDCADCGDSHRESLAKGAKCRESCQRPRHRLPLCHTHAFPTFRTHTLPYSGI